MLRQFQKLSRSKLEFAPHAWLGEKLKKSPEVPHTIPSVTELIPSKLVRLLFIFLLFVCDTAASFVHFDWDLPN